MSEKNYGKTIWNTQMNYKEGLIPNGKFTTAHAPALLELDNGDILCAWFAGSYEGNTDISIVCSKWDCALEHWDQPVKISLDSERSEQNPSFFRKSNDEIWLIYTAQLGRVEGKFNMQYTAEIRYQVSKDNGKTWSKASKLLDGEGNFCRQTIQKLKDGRWIFGTWKCYDSDKELGDDITVIQISDDMAKSWKAVEIPQSIGKVHATLIEEDKELLAFFRSRYADNIYRSISTDHGESWSIPNKTVLPNNNSGISVIKLKSGKIMIAYNPTSAPQPENKGAVWPGLRCPIAVAISEDKGITWPYIRIMELGEGYIGTQNKTCNSAYEYPCLMQSADGKIHLTYAYRNRECIKHIIFDEEDITGEFLNKKIVFNPTNGDK